MDKVCSVESGSDLPDLPIGIDIYISKVEMEMGWNTNDFNELTTSKKIKFTPIK